ncbi:MAG: hypothetical protein CVV27_20630 [Candidatus Melainabacteria bacterium HGW-Melainabacteria-1]|nr:MAG: hypothetical protein CVV27_20630 [Candidatus Melainabacteria bacterium HGW-Melainabacteria-1]
MPAGTQEVSIRHDAMNISDTHRFVKTGEFKWRWEFDPLNAEKSEVILNGYGLDVTVVKSGKTMPKKLTFAGKNLLPDKTVITIKRSGRSAEIRYECTDKSIPPAAHPFAVYTVSWN